MQRRDQVLESLREMEDGMLITGTAEHISQIDLPRLLWCICKALYLLLKKEAGK